MPVKKIDGVDLYYEIEGKGAETVAFLNGIGMTVKAWQPIRGRILARGYRCLLHDCRGQLRSGKPIDSPYSMELHVADFLSLLDELGTERAHLVGTSYGSEIGMLFACTHPERTASLTAIAGVSELDGLMRAAAESWAVAADHGAMPFFRCMLPWVYSSEYLVRNRELLRHREEAAMLLPPDYFAAFKRLVGAFLQFDITDRLNRILCPTLVISAERDLIKGPRFGRLIHENIAGSEFVVIPGAGHAVVLEQPDKIAEHTIDFIARH